jgi:hypothetical protein
MNVRENPAALWPTYAMRAWLAALVAETRRSQLELDARIEHFEKEVARLQKQKERSRKVVESLNESIGIVDNVLRRVRDTEVDEHSYKEDRGRESEKTREGERSREESKEERRDAKPHPPEKRAR